MARLSCVKEKHRAVEATAKGAVPNFTIILIGSNDFIFFLVHSQKLRSTCKYSPNNFLFHLKMFLKTIFFFTRTSNCSGHLSINQQQITTIDWPLFVFSASIAHRFHNDTTCFAFAIPQPKLHSTEEEHSRSIAAENRKQTYESITGFMHAKRRFCLRGTQHLSDNNLKICF